METTEHLNYYFQLTPLYSCIAGPFRDTIHLQERERCFLSSPNPRSEDSMTASHIQTIPGDSILLPARSTEQAFTAIFETHHRRLLPPCSLPLVRCWRLALVALHPSPSQPTRQRPKPSASPAPSPKPRSKPSRPRGPLLPLRAFSLQPPPRRNLIKSIFDTMPADCSPARG